MNQTELRNAAANWMVLECKKFRKPPHDLKFRAKEVAHAVGGYAGQLGHVAEKVAEDVSAQGYACTYVRLTSGETFQLRVEA